MNRIILLRHGENRANLTKEFSYKKIDYPLTEKGVLQAQQTAEALRGRGIGAIYTSPLKRAQQTAQIVGEAVGLTPTVDEAFREFNVGRLEDSPASKESWDQYHQVIHAWVAGRAEVAFPGGENNCQLWARYENGLRKVILAHPGQTLLIVGHAGIFTATLPQLCPGVSILDLLKTENHNASLTEINVELKDDQLIGQLRSWANTDHLSGEAAQFVSGTPHRGELS
jgi:broad specificity phosphatase PhoE